MGCLVGAGCNRRPGRSSGDPKTEEDKAFYALGLDIGKNIEFFSLSPAEQQLVHDGLDDYLNHRTPKVDLEKTSPKIREIEGVRRTARAERERAKGKAALEKLGKEPGARVLPSGMVFRTLRPGTGASPKKPDEVKVTYEGRLLDGTVFDSSAKNNGPAELKVEYLGDCWINGLMEMKAGEKAQFYCSAEVLTSGRRRPGGVPAGATVVFEVDLLEVKSAPQAPPSLSP